MCSLFKPTHHTQEKDEHYMACCECWKELRMMGEVVLYRLSLICRLWGGTTFPRFTGALWGAKGHLMRTLRERQCVHLVAGKMLITASGMERGTEEDTP